jgi:hypothetical protein
LLLSSVFSIHDDALRACPKAPLIADPEYPLKCISFVTTNTRWYLAIGNLISSSADSSILKSGITLLFYFLTLIKTG